MIISSDRSRARGPAHARPAATEALQRILLVVCAIIVGIVLIEIPAITGLADYGRVLGIDAAWQPLNRIPDPELRFTGRPYAHYMGSALGGNATLEYRIPAPLLTKYNWDVSYDDHGFRNPAGLRKADIAVIGDSYVEGITVPAPSLMTSVLAHAINSTVANLGQSGYGPRQELIVLKRFAITLHPSLVIWMFYEGNDLSDVDEYDRAMNRSSDISGGVWRRSFVRNALRRVWQFRRPPGSQASGIVQKEGGSKATFFFDRQSAASASSLTEASLRDLDTTATIIRQAQDLCSAQGCSLAVAFIPTAFRVLSGYCEFPAGSKCRNWRLNDLPQRFQRALKAASPMTPVLDLTPALADSVRNGSSPYYRDDAHWTEDGQRVAGLTLAGFAKSLLNK